MNLISKVKKGIGVALLVVMPIVVMADQEVVLNVVADNTIMRSSVNSSVANNVYTWGGDIAGNNHTVTCTPGFGCQYDFTGQATLMKFDVASLTGKTILQAFLRLVPVDLAGNPYQASQMTDYRVNACASYWNPSTVTWNTGPTFSIYYQSVFEVPQGTLPIGIDVTDIVKNWVSGAWSNFGLIIWDAYNVEPDTSASCACLNSTVFGDKEGGGVKVPQLVVTIIEDTPVPPPASKFMPGIISTLLLD